MRYEGNLLSTADLFRTRVIERGQDSFQTSKPYLSGSERANPRTGMPEREVQIWIHDQREHLRVHLLGKRIGEERYRLALQCGSAKRILSIPRAEARLYHLLVRARGGNVWRAE